MTTPVEVKTTTTKKRAKPVRREFNALGRFFAKVRIDTGLTTDDWAERLQVSPLTVNKVERTDSPMSYDYAVKVAVLVSEIAPQYNYELAGIIANTLGIMLIPAYAHPDNVSRAYGMVHAKERVELVAEVPAKAE